MNNSMMPFNIFFVMGQNPTMEDEYGKKEKDGKASKTESLLAKMLKQHEETSSGMMAQLTLMADKLRRLPMTSAVGGG
jgi:hypothetical protein